MKEFKKQTYQHLKTHKGGTRANSREEKNVSRKTQHKFEDWKMTKTVKDSGETIEQMSGDTCATARVLSCRKKVAVQRKAHTTATSAAAMKRSFSLKCRRPPRELELVKSVTRARLTRRHVLFGTFTSMSVSLKSRHTAAAGSDRGG